VLFVNCPLEDFYDVTLGKPAVSSINIVQVLQFLSSALSSMNKTMQGRWLS
jgi:hypothetical protein